MNTSPTGSSHVGSLVRQSSRSRPPSAEASTQTATVMHAAPGGTLQELGAGASAPEAITLMVTAAFRDYAASIHGVALRTTRDPELAADVTQEAFLRLVFEAQAGRCPDNVKAWLHRTSANLIISRARRTAVANRLAPRLMQTDEPDRPDAIAVQREGHEELLVALATLPTAERIALLMAAEGATGEEIAHSLGRSNGATRTMMSRARARLRVARDVATDPALRTVAAPVVVAGPARATPALAR